jgi:hypothetical protein
VLSLLQCACALFVVRCVQCACVLHVQCASGETIAGEQTGWVVARDCLGNTQPREPNTSFSAAF